MSSETQCKATPREPTSAMLGAVTFKPHPTRPNGWSDRHADMWRRMWDAYTERECCNAECGWAGATDRMCGAVGPLCPQCGEVTEAVAAPTDTERLRTAIEEALASIECGMVAGAVETLKDALSRAEPPATIPAHPAK